MKPPLIGKGLVKASGYRVHESAARSCSSPTTPGLSISIAEQGIQVQGLYANG